MNDYCCSGGEFTIEPLDTCPSCCELSNLPPDAVMTVRWDDLIVGWTRADCGVMFSVPTFAIPRRGAL
jgi:hypothetical protein